MKAPITIGRLVFGGYFLYSGIHHFLEKDKLTQYAGAKKVPAPDLAVTATGLALILGGTSILLNVKPQIGGMLIAAFLAGVSPAMHDFWRHQDPNQRMNDMTHFMKNIALLGAALALTRSEEDAPVSSALERVKKTAWRVLAA
jgi:putative oxidoreductase